MGTRRRFLQLLGGGGLAAGVGWPSSWARAREVAAPRLAYRRGVDLAAWQAELREWLVQALALRRGSPAGPLDAVVEKPMETGEYFRQQISFAAEDGERVPGWLLRPKAARAPYPVMICLQGHSPGMHLSLGEARNARERDLVAGGRDLALQAVRQGWAALVIEQRAFGLRAQSGVSCSDAALRALHQGRPLTGQRVGDVMRALDFAEAQPDLDAKRMACVGNSTGGTVSFYAACVDVRLSLAVVSCSFCTFADSWLTLPHCACGYVAGAGPVADMPDLAGLIAPRRFLIVAGRKDHLARIEGVERGYRHARDIFAAAGAEDRIRLVVGDGGHQFFPDLAWPVVRAMMAAG